MTLYSLFSSLDVSFGITIVNMYSHSYLLAVKLGSPTDEDLQDVAGEIGGKWKALGRQLKIQESQLTGFDRDQPDEYEKAYAVLVEWKQRGGSENATYQILKEALCHALVGRRDLAEEFCCLNNSVS